MVPRPISRVDLERLVTEALRREPGCAGVSQVAIHLGASDDADGNWDVSIFDPGTADPRTCRRALAKTLPSLKSRYRLLGD